MPSQLSTYNIDQCECYCCSNDHKDLSGRTIQCDHALVFNTIWIDTRTPMSSEVEGKVQWASAWVPHQGGAINFVKFICRSGACHSAECTMDNSTCTSALGTAGWSTEYIGSYFLVYFGACCLACPHCSRLGQDGPGLLAANRLGFPNDEHVAVSPAAHAPAPCSHALHLVYAGAHWTCLATLRNASHASNEFEPGTTGHLRLSRPCKCCRARARPRWLRDHECLTSPVLQCLT